MEIITEGLYKDMKITVITPTWNQAEFIEETIKSVVGQTWKDIEYIIIDNCSDDGTDKIVEKYMKEYPCITYIREPDYGQAEAINKGFERATGDIICWINSDDFYYSDTVFEKVCNVFETKKDCHILVGDGIYCDREGRLTEPIPCGRGVKPWVLSRWYYILQPAVFWRREKEIFLDVKYKYVFDWKFFIELQQRHPFTFLPECLSVYRMYEDNKTGLDNAARKKEVYLMQKELDISRVNTEWCRIVYLAYENAERTGKNGKKKVVKWMSRVLFHITGKRVCSF